MPQDRKDLSTPSQRPTYRVKVVQGRKSIIWAKSILPAFMASSGKKADSTPKCNLSATGEVVSACRD